MTRYVRFMTLVAVAVITFAVAGCGGSGSSTGSLTLAVDNAAVTGGDVIVATVTLTAAGKSVRGIGVRVMSSDQSVIADASGNVNEDGTAKILLKVNNVSSDRSIYLVAGSDYSSESTSVKVTITAPKLTVTIPGTITPPAWSNNFAFIGKTIVSNYTLKFAKGNGDVIPNQVISLYIDSITNKNFDDMIVYTPFQGNQIVAPPGVFTGTTDSSGNLIVPMYVQMYLNLPSPCSTNPTTGVFSCTGTAISVMTVNWRAVAQYAGQTITTTASSLVTFTNTGK
ncbi:MAG: hypothetical protein WCP10_12040 [Desulfuromonadales bacterium]